MHFSHRSRLAMHSTLCYNSVERSIANRATSIVYKIKRKGNAMGGNKKTI
jgi:hypothetical protein